MIGIKMYKTDSLRLTCCVIGYVLLYVWICKVIIRLNIRVAIVIITDANDVFVVLGDIAVDLVCI